MSKLKALLFDCDGVLAETERDGHRVGYNAAMKELGVDGEWSVELYADLLKIAGGKERMRYFFESNREKYPEDKFNTELIEKLYKVKTEIFKGMANRGDLPGRSGIARIVKEAKAQGIQLFVCSTSHKASVSALIESNFGKECLDSFTELYCGDVVPKKKPAPDIYLLASKNHNLDPKDCLVVEDSHIGLMAAKAAGMNCIVTPSFYTFEEDFSTANAVVSCLGDPGGEETTFIRTPIPCDKKYVDIEYMKALVENA